MKKKSSKRQKMDKSDVQFFWVVAIITLLIITIIVTPIIYKKFFTTFEYGGVQFEKIKSGQTTFYHGVFPINYLGKTYSYHNVYFYTDPRKNNVALNTNVSLSKIIYVSLSKDMQSCSDIQLGQVTLGSFLNAFPFVNNVTGAISEEDYANANNLPYASCQNATKNTTVIMVNNSQAESIEKISENCYSFNIGDCNYMPVVERFIIGSMAQINEVKI